MKNSLVLCVMLVAAACGGSKKSSDTTMAGGGGGMNEPATADDEVDPTIPSWAPKTCIAYHRAVTQALACDAIEQGKRDEIKASYETANNEWQAETNANAERIEAVKASCETATESVRADIGTNCVP